MKDVVVFSIASAEYLENMKGLCASLYVNGHTYIPHMVYILETGPTVKEEKENVTKELLSVNPKVHLEWQEKTFSSQQEKAEYCAGARVYVFQALRQQYQSKILFYCDADTIIRGEIEQLLSKLWSEYDVCVRCKPTDRLGLKREQTNLTIGKVWSGIIGVAPSNSGNQFLLEYKKQYEVLRKTKPSWYSDQQSLSIAVFATGYQESVRLYNIPEIFMDFHMTETSVLWTAKGNLCGGRSGARFVREASVWIEKALEKAEQ